MMKKFLSLVVAALLTVGAVATSASAAKFTDVDASNEALNDAVELLVALGVTKGTSDTTFGTDENVTREQMAAFVYRMMKAGKSVEGGTNVSPFVDLDDPTFYFMISWASSQGIIKGTSATTFNPKGGITLQDAYTMIVRALGYDNGALTYPVGHINKAEDLGLDEDLPSSLNYTDTLTRGNLAIILANMFYAETSETEIRYETEIVRWEDRDLDNDGTADETYPITTQKPVEYNKTVAEAVFEVVKVSQRVVATPSHKFDDAVRPDEDVEMIVLAEGMSADADDYTSVGDLGTVEFADLGLEGKADDYFLSDILMFVKVEDDGDRVIYGATAQGETKTVSFDDIEFGTVSGTSADKYYDGENKEIKKFNGLLTIDGVKTYLYGAPYSYAKDPYNYDKYAPTFITLGTWDGDIEEEEIFVDYVTVDQFADDVDVIGEWSYDSDAETYVNNAAGYLSQIYLGGLGEVDCIDSDGNGKYDYLFVKNYSVGTIDTTEEESLRGTGDVTVITDTNAKDALIYTDYSVVEGVEFADEDVVLAYINEAANYVKVVEVLKGVEATISTAASKYYALSTGEKIYYDYADMAVTNGAENGIFTSADEVTDFTSETVYYFASNGTLVYAGNLATALNLNENWVVVLEDRAFKSANMVDGKLEKAYYIDIYNDGAIKSVKARDIADTDDKYYEADVTPVTNKAFTYNDAGEITGTETVAEYGYAEYVNKLATGKSDKNGAYYFKRLVEGYEAVEDDEDTEEDESMTVAEVKAAAKEALKGDDEAAEYRDLTAGTVEFYQNSGYKYYLGDETVNIKPYTQIILRTVDEEGKDIVTAYGYDNLPNIKEHTEFSNVQYVLTNNTGSRRFENLAVFFGTLGVEMEGAKGEMEELRVLTSYAKTTTEDETVYTYNVLNPFKGAAEQGLTGLADEGLSVRKGDIFGLTSEGYIYDEVDAFGNVFTPGTYYNVDASGAISGLGYVVVSSYDEAAGSLEVKTSEGEAIDVLLEITDETVVSFADKSAGGIKVVDKAALGSTAATYRQGNVRTGELRVFLCVEEHEDYEDDTNELYVVKFAMIVRD